jgi:hypothetical protein
MSRPFRKILFSNHHAGSAGLRDPVGGAESGDPIFVRNSVNNRR